MQRTQSLTRPTTHAAISTFSTSHNSISSQYSQPFTSLAAPKANQYSMLQIKTYSQKPISTLAILLLPPPFISHNLARGLTTLSKETTQHKHPGTLQPILANSKLSHTTNKPTSPAKIILQKLWLYTLFNNFNTEV